MSESEDQFFLTNKGEIKLRAELEELLGPRRLEISQRLNQAIKMGDISENADYSAAKEAQAFIEGRIQELETVLRRAIIIEEKGPTDLVRIGSLIIISINSEEPETYQLVGVKEADPRNGKISYQSPIGKALLGQKADDTACVETPSGKIEIKILDIR